MGYANKLKCILPVDAHPMQVSKWLQCQVLVDEQEMIALLSFLKPFFLYKAGVLVNQGEGEISIEEFLSVYTAYVRMLKEGILPDEGKYRSYFSSVFTVSPDCLFAVSVEKGQQLIRPERPVIQLQPHRLGWSEADRKFRPMVFGKDSISWGIQFSYPQLYRDPKTQEVTLVASSERFPNTALYRRLQRWVRQHTAPTPFCVGKDKINVPMRLGKECFSWINRHPQLATKGIKVFL